MPLWTAESVSAAINAAKSARPGALRLWKGVKRDDGDSKKEIGTKENGKREINKEKMV